MEAHHEERRAVGVEVDVDACWPVDEVGIPAKARLWDLDRFMNRLEDARLVMCFQH